MPGELLRSGVVSGSVSGGLVTVLLRLLHEAATNPAPLPSLECICPAVDFGLLSFEQLDLRSLGVGILIGLLLWPLLELIFVIKALLGSAVRSRVRRLSGAEPYYRLL